MSQLSSNRSILAFVLVLFGATGVLLPANAESPQPITKLVVLSPTNADEIVETEVKITNKTNTDLRLAKGEVDCGCLSIVKQPDVIKAGAVGMIKLRLNTSGMQGLNTKQALIRASHPTISHVSITVDIVVSGVWASPSSIDLGTITSSEKISREFFVIATKFADAKVIDVVPSNPSLRVSRSAAKADENSRNKDIHALTHVRVDWNGTDLPPGKFTGTLTVRTNVPGHSDFKVPVTAYVSGSANITPSRIFFGKLDSGSERIETCKINFTESIDLDSLRITSDHPFVSGEIVSWDSEKDELVVDVKITAPEVAKNQLLKGALRLQSGESPICSVPYICYVVAK